MGIEQVPNQFQEPKAQDQTHTNKVNKQELNLDQRNKQKKNTLIWQRIF